MSGSELKMPESDCSNLLIRLRLHSTRESVAVDHSQLVNSASNQFMLVASFKLHGDNRPITVNDASVACDILAKWSRSQMLDINMNADGIFMGFQAWQDRFARGVFQEPDQPRRA
jgi:hypothetical protein